MHAQPHTILYYYTLDPGVIQPRPLAEHPTTSSSQNKTNTRTRTRTRPTRSALHASQYPRPHSSPQTRALALYSQYNHKSFQQQQGYQQQQRYQQQQSPSQAHRSGPSKSSTTGDGAYKINSAYHSVAPPANRYSNKTYFGQLRNDYSGGNASQSYLTQSYGAEKTRYPLVKSILNPFTSLYQRIKFVILPRDDEHRNRKPWNVPIERVLNRWYQRYHTWSFTHAATNRRRTTFGKYALFTATVLGICYYLANLKPKVDKTAVLPHSAVYQPEYPEQHVPFRSALLPHTLPSQLSGPDSLFVNDFLDGSSTKPRFRTAAVTRGEDEDGKYDATQIIRPEEVRRFERPTFAYGRTSSGLYSTSVFGWGQDAKLHGTGKWTRKPLVDDVPKPVESRDVYSGSTKSTEDDIHIRATELWHRMNPEVSPLVPELIPYTSHQDLNYRDRKNKTKAQFSGKQEDVFDRDPYGEWKRPPGKV